jgi:hypothetical protein
MSNELKLKEENMFLAGNDGYTGFENVSAECLSIPFIKLAQDTTAQAKEKNPSHVEGLEPGFFFNSVSSRVYGDSLNVIILGQAHNYIEWGEGSGLIKNIYSENEYEALSNDKKEETIKSGLYKGKKVIGENFSVFVYLPDFPEDGIMIMPMVATKIKYWKKWLTRTTNVIIEGKKMKLFACIWNVKTILNDGKDNTWYNIGKDSSVLVKNMGLVPSNHFSAIKEALQTVQTYINRAKDIDYSKVKDTEVEDEE